MTTTSKSLMYDTIRYDRTV